MATPKMASSAPMANVGVMRSLRNNTLEIRAKTGSSRANGATRAMVQRAIRQNQTDNSSDENSVGERHPGTLREGIVTDGRGLFAGLVEHFARAA